MSKRGPLRNLTECRQNEKNTSLIWLRGFELASNHHCSPRQIIEKCAKIVRIAKSTIIFLLIVDCVSNHINEWHQVTKRKNFEFIFIFSEVTAQIRWSVSIILWSVALRHLTRRKKCDGYWLPGAKSFRTVYYMNDFAAIISRGYYTLNS